MFSNVSNAFAGITDMDLKIPCLLQLFDRCSAVSFGWDWHFWPAAPYVHRFGGLQLPKGDECRCGLIGNHQAVRKRLGRGALGEPWWVP